VPRSATSGPQAACGVPRIQPEAAAVADRLAADRGAGRELADQRHPTKRSGLPLRTPWRSILPLCRTSGDWP